MECHEGLLLIKDKGIQWTYRMHLDSNIRIKRISMKDNPVITLHPTSLIITNLSYKDPLYI